MKYTIVHIDDRCKENIKKVKNVLKDFQYIDHIKFFDGNKNNGKKVLIDRGIDVSKWNPYDGRKSPPLLGEYGVWVTTINFLSYIVNNKIDKMLILEDDISLSDNFLDIFNKCVDDLPKNFDFLSLYWNEGHNQKDSRTDIGSQYIHRSINQYSGALGMIYSYNGARKILSAVQRLGMQYTNDCFIFKMSQIGVINGFSILKSAGPIISHDWSVKSSIDPEDNRKIYRQ